MSVRIAILVEGSTETILKQPLQNFLTPLLTNQMPKLIFLRQNGRIPKREDLKRHVTHLLNSHPCADAVIALTDVYTGGNDFQGAGDAKQKMREWVGKEPRFHPHVALYDFEAWLLPYWGDIQRLAGSNRASPNASPEHVNHGYPPARVLAEVFRTGTKGKVYSKIRDGSAILRDKDLNIAAQACPELRAFLNTIIAISQNKPLPAPTPP